MDSGVKQSNEKDNYVLMLMEAEW